ncbi:hypothetical protein [Neisseria chenwenguii]|uniref:hypothetical protein n=1 Tax=Neisseria chenwenguii TaxID=1853278 RepID=UPI0018F5F7DB|nr:hypothetical protein [Neisseria chenwenguii]
MYQIDNSNGWDTDYFHTLMGEKRIVSSTEAKNIRNELSNAGALPPLDNNFDGQHSASAIVLPKDWSGLPVN